MPTPRDPGASTAYVEAVLRRVRTRVTVRHALQSVAAAAIAFGVVAVAMRMLPAATGVRVAIAGVAGLSLAVAFFMIRRRERTAPAAARLIERPYQSLHNLAVTAEELIASPDRARPYMRERVLQEAARAMAGIDPARVVPLARDAVLLVVAVLAVIVALPYARAHRSVELPFSKAARASATSARSLAIDLAPPAYTGRPVVHLHDPASIDALAGSRASIAVTGGVRPSIRINGTVVPTGADGIAHTTLTESGYIAIEADGLQRLLPLTVTPDALPVVRVSKPGKDLRVADAKATIPVLASASDDLGLRALELRYTIISGSGEQFTFIEGSMPATLVRTTGREWSTSAVLSLSSLKLEPGDALIYRAVASDARPGSTGEASSDTYFVEIAGPGDVALEGVDMPPDKERYALSEAMIVVKIQRLIAREAGMPRADVADAAAGIAAEQRAVRANFIFLLGGEIEDEVVEAETSHEIQEGRLANQSRKEIVAATVLMGKVDQALAAVSTRSALPLAQEAVRTLQRAFGHSRYLLRALPARIRIDPSRRLSGNVTEVRDWSRELGSHASDPQEDAARDAMAEITHVARDPRSADAAGRLTRLAERVLAIAPGAADLQRSSRQLLEARDASARGDIDTARSALQGAAAPLLLRAQRGRIDAPSVNRDAARLAGAAAVGGGVR